MTAVVPWELISVVAAVSGGTFYWFKTWFCSFFLFAESDPELRKLYAKTRRCMLFSAHYACTFAWFAWLWVTRLPWTTDAVECTLPPTDHVMESSVALLFAVQLGFYAAGLYELLVQDAKTRAKDWPIMLGHHLVTLALIVSCTRFGAYWIGFYVLGLHDAGDIFLYASDAMHQWTTIARSKKGVASERGIQLVDNIKTGTFAVFMVVFAYTRLYRFAWYFVLGSCGRVVLDTWTTSFSMGPMWLGMLALSAMHVYWFYLTCAMLKRLLVQGGDAQDVRNKDE